MINIYKNPNFQNWWNICQDGNLIDNASSKAKALAMAKKIGREKNTSVAMFLKDKELVVSSSRSNT